MNYGFSKANLPILKNERGRESIFTYYYFKGTRMPLFGYKIHISATRENLLRVKKIVSDYCKSNKVNFKVVSTKRIYLSSLVKSFDRTFIGKYLTLYPENSDKAKLICEELYQLLKDERGPAILTDRAYKDSIVQYRYGGFLSEYPKGSGSGKVIDSDGREFIDQRIPGRYKPDSIPDLFEQPETEIPDRIKNYIIKTPVYFSSYGGVYLVQRESELDLKEPVYYVIKEARENLGITDNDDPLVRKLHEAKLAKSLNLDFLPRFHEYFYIEGNLYLVFDYSPGLGLDGWKDQMNLNSIWQLHPNRKPLIEDAALRLLERFDYVLERSKQADLILNDVKANNFVWDGDQRLTFIDLDCSFKKGEKPIKILNRYLKRDRIFDWRCDIKKVGYLVSDLLSSSESIQNQFTDHNHTLEFFLYFAKRVKLDPRLRDKLYRLLEFKSKDFKDIHKGLTRAERAKIDRLAKPKFKVKVNKKIVKKLDLNQSIFKNTTERAEGFAADLWNQALSHLEQGEQEQTKQAIDKLLERVIDKIEDYKSVLFEEDVISTFLNNGSSKLVLLLLRFNKQFKEQSYEQLTRELLTGLKSEFILNTSFIDGGWGVVYTFLQAFNHLKNEAYLEDAQDLAYTLLRFFKHQKTDNYFNANRLLLADQELEDVKRIIDCFLVEKITD